MNYTTGHNLFAVVYTKPLNMLKLPPLEQTFGYNPNLEMLGGPVYPLATLKSHEILRWVSFHSL